MRRTLTWLLAFLPLCSVCSCSSSDTGTLQLVTGGETDTFSQSPQPTKLVVYAVDASNNRTTVASSSLPTSGIDLGSQDENAVATLEVVATDSSGAEVVAGASLPLQYGALASATLPIFVQRVDQFARLPSPPAGDTRQAPTLADIAGEFLFIGGGTSAATAQTTQLYDFATLTPLTAPPALPLVPQSIAFVSTVGLLLDGASGVYFDFSQDADLAVTPPSGFSFADVAGGQTVYGVDGSGNLTDVYIVGGTRTTGAPTAAVLHIDPNNLNNSSYPTGNLSWITLSTPRLGAAATWILGRGLMVAGGSGSGAGVEQIASGASVPTGSALPFPADATIGAGATTLGSDTQHLLLLGGLTPTGQDAGARELDLLCTSSCGTSTGTNRWMGALPVPVTSSAAFPLPSGGTYAALVIGSELESGLTHAFLVSSTTATEVPTRVPHFNARAIVSPVGSFLLFGGSAGEIESFQPTL